MQSGVTMPTDKTPELLAALERLTTADVLVGIPAPKTGRREGRITNASLAFIHEYGSPARNIPARPFMRPGINNAKDQIAAIMKRGAQQALKTGDQQAVDKTLEKVGMIARNSVVRAITDPSPAFAPLGSATIRARLRRTAAGRRKLQTAQRLRKAKGLSGDAALASALGLPDLSQQGLLFKPLIDTGQLRAAISYVVRHGVVPFAKSMTAWGYQRDYGKVFTKT